MTASQLVASRELAALRHEVVLLVRGAVGGSYALHARADGALVIPAAPKIRVRLRAACWHTYGGVSRPHLFLDPHGVGWGTTHELAAWLYAGGVRAQGVQDDRS